MKFYYMEVASRDKNEADTTGAYRPETISSKIGKKLNLENKDDWFSSRSPFILTNIWQH
jgi:hypothetical protein